MNLKIIIFAFFLCFNFLKASEDKPYLILLSWDACRWDYIDRGLTPNVQKLIETGARAKTLKSCFPTKTFPNHYAIVTGMYPENHGIIFNNFTDFSTGESYRKKKDDSVKQDKWYKGEPIWFTAQKQGIKSGSLFWIGSEVYKKGPTYVRAYDHYLPHQERLNQIEEWLNLPESDRPRFLLMYFADLDDAGHHYGPDSPQLDSALINLDATLGDLFLLLDKKGIREKTNILLVTDHGMIKTEKENGIDLQKILEGYNYNLQGYDPIFTLFADNDQLGNIYNTLKKNEIGFKTYWKTKFPARFHFNNNPLIGDIIILAEPEYYFISENGSYSTGVHGYDNNLKDMQGIFVASGPAFKENYISDTFTNIDIYALMCEILGIKPNAPVDADLERVKHLLK